MDVFLTCLWSFWFEILECFQRNQQTTETVQKKDVKDVIPLLLTSDFTHRSSAYIVYLEQ